MKAADSLIIFLDNGARSTVVPSKMLYRCKKNRLPNVRTARFRNWGQMRNNWPNHKINGYSGSPKSLIQADDGQNSELIFLVCSIRSYSAPRKVYGDKNAILSRSTGMYIYMKLKFRHSSALSLAKRVYAILCKNENSALVFSLSKRIYTFSCEKEMSSEKNCTEQIILCYLHL
jgi:hypothetical protein